MAERGHQSGSAPPRERSRDGSRDDDHREHDAPDERGGEPGGGGRISARRAGEQAANYVDEVTGQPPEVVTAVESHEDGWLVRVEVLELARVPDSTDVLACYEVELDPAGEPRSYRRTRRYYRAGVGEE